MNGNRAIFSFTPYGTKNRIICSRSDFWRKFFIVSAAVATVIGPSATSVPAAISADYQQDYQAADDMAIPSAVQISVVFKQELDSAKLTNNEQIEVELKEDLTINDELIAPAGSIVVGHIEELQQSRRMAEAAVSGKHRFKKGSSLKIAFDEIITPEDNHFKVVGCLSRQSQSFTEDGRPRQVEISKKGELTKAEESFSTEEKVTSQVVNFAAGTGLNTLGTVASFGASAVVMGVLGAYDPALVAPRPLRKDEKHPRVKGFAFGVFESLPGAPVMSAMIFKGSDIHIQPGDEYLAQIHSPYPETVPVLSLSSKVVRSNVVKPAAPAGAAAKAGAGSAAGGAITGATTTAGTNAAPNSTAPATPASGTATAPGPTPAASGAVPSAATKAAPPSKSAGTSATPASMAAAPYTAPATTYSASPAGLSQSTAPSPVHDAAQTSPKPVAPKPTATAATQSSVTK
jgi:hypothetical protein